MNDMFQIDVNLKGLFKTDEGGKGREEGKKRQKAHIKKQATGKERRPNINTTLCIDLAQ